MSLLTSSMTRREMLAALAGVALSACFSDRPTEPDAEEHVVEMREDLTFSPEVLTIEAGDTVTWRNVSSFAHTATADPAEAQDPSNVELPDGAIPWNSGSLAAGEEFSRRFDVPGGYRYFCIPHETLDMVARIIVNP